jgi:hypothetical protein
LSVRKIGTVKVYTFCRIVANFFLWHSSYYILNIHHIVLYYSLKLLELYRNLDAINNEKICSLILWHNVLFNVYRYPAKVKIVLSEKVTSSKDTYVLISVKYRVYVTNLTFSMTGVRKWLTIFILSVLHWLYQHR